MRTYYQITKWLSTNLLFLLLSVFLSFSSQAAPDFKIPDKVCSWRSVSFENTSTVDSLALDSFSWYFEGAQNEYADTNVAVWIDIQTSKSVTVRLTQYLKNGDSLTQSKIVSVLESAGPSFTSPTLCDADTAVFTNVSFNKDIEYLWHFGDGVSDTGFHAKHLYAFPRTYNVTLVPLFANVCSDAVKRPVVVNPSPNASFTYRRDGRTVEFDGPAGNDIYRWTFGDGGRADFEDPIYTYLESPIGKEVCLATKFDACWSEECQYFEPWGNISEVEKNIDIYPNPTLDRLTVELLDSKLMQSIEVIDLLGNRILANELLVKQNAVVLDLSNKSPGVYFVRVNSEGQVGTKRIVIAR